MNYVIVYTSPTGNTKLLAQAILQVIPGEGCLFCGQQSDWNISDCDLLFIGFWTDKGTCSVQTREVLHGLENKKIVLFGTAGFGESEEYFNGILKRVAAELPKSNTVIGGFMCQGKMPITVKKRYEAMLENNPDNVNTKLLIENFDKALTHPDSTDISAVQEFAKKIYRQISA